MLLDDGAAQSLIRSDGQNARCFFHSLHSAREPLEVSPRDWRRCGARQNGVDGNGTRRLRLHDRDDFSTMLPLALDFDLELRVLNMHHALPEGRWPPSWCVSWTSTSWIPRGPLRTRTRHAVPYPPGRGPT